MEERLHTPEKQLRIVGDRAPPPRVHQPIVRNSRSERLAPPGLCHPVERGERGVSYFALRDRKREIRWCSAEESVPARWPSGMAYANAALAASATWVTARAPASTAGPSWKNMCTISS
jgi:hypothetical protein